MRILKRLQSFRLKIIIFDLLYSHALLPSFGSKVTKKAKKVPLSHVRCESEYLAPAAATEEGRPYDLIIPAPSGVYREMPATGLERRAQSSGFKATGLEFGLQNAGLRVRALELGGLRAQALELRDQSSGFKARALERRGLRAQTLELRAQSSGFKAWAFERRAQSSFSTRCKNTCS